MSPSREALEALAELSGQPIPTFEGFDEALVGTALVSCGHSRSIRAVYDRAKALHLLVARDGVSPEDAAEHLEYNVAGSILADAPIFLSHLP